MSCLSDLEIKFEMKTEGFPEVMELCRFCVEKVKDYSSIFTENLHESLDKYMGVTVQEFDNWPKFICKKCLAAAKISLDFISSIRRAESTLRSLFGDLGESIDMKPDIEMIDMKEVIPDVELDDYIVDQEISECPTNHIESDESSEKPQEKRRGKNRGRKPTQTTKKSLEIATKSKASTLKRRPPIRRSAKELKEEDDRIRKFFKMQCSVCPESEIFESFRLFRSHAIRVHKDKKEAFIMCCEKKLDDRTKIVSHLNRHVNPEAYRCSTCGRTFLTANGLHVHNLNTHVPKEEHKFTCDTCQRTFMTISRLKGHQLSHLKENEKKFKCPQCDKAFANRSILTQHIRHNHTDYNKHVCEICAKQFRAKCSYQQHMTSHFDNGVKGFSCSICEKSFKLKTLLSIHMRRHNDEGKIFKCDVCGKESPNSLALKNHIRYTHIKKRNHKCNLCSSAFRRPIELKEHLATHSANQILYTCLFCPKQFNSNANKYAHQKKAHPVEYEAAKKKKTLRNKMNLS